MAENSKIEWCHATFNPWRGCAKVSAGCANCYAETLSGRNPRVLGVWGPNGTRVVAAEAQWREPLRWNAAAAARGERHRVFCASLADVFEDWQGPMVEARGQELFFPHNSWQDRRPWIPHEDCGGGEPPVTMGSVRRRLFELIGDTPHLDWLLLTKRPENVLRLTRAAIDPTGEPHGNEMAEPNGLDAAGFGELYPNVWLGTSVENQAAADERIPELLKVPAAVRFLSCEPLLGPVDLRRFLPNTFTRFPRTPRVGWVIVGGESGPGARPMHPDWARSVRDQCVAAGVPFFFKQWGEYREWRESDGDSRTCRLPYVQMHPDGRAVVPAGESTSWNAARVGFDALLVRAGKKAAGRLLDGREWDEFPT